MFSYPQAKFLVVHKYLFLFISFVAGLILYPLSFEDPIATSIIHSMLIVALISISYIIEHKSHLFMANFITGLVLIAIFPIVIFYPSDFTNVIRAVFLLTFYIVNIMILLNDITHQSRITHDYLLGSLCVYIMIALLYAGIYNHVEIYIPGSFQFNTKEAMSHLEKTFNMVYFSFTTLTTVGYGDIVPLKVLAKSIVVLEQITGIFYLAVLVSRLVIR